MTFTFLKFISVYSIFIVAAVNGIWSSIISSFWLLFVNMKVTEFCIIVLLIIF